MMARYARELVTSSFFGLVSRGAGDTPKPQTPHEC